MITAGKLNRRVTIQKQATTQDAFGTLLQDWTNVATVWASIDIQQSQLLYSTAEFVSKVTYRITIRWSRDFEVSAKNRVVYTNPASGVTHTYEVMAVVNTRAANDERVILCYELNGGE